MLVKRVRLLFAGLPAVAYSAAGLLGAGRGQQPGGAPQLDVASRKAVIQQYCAGCHNEKVKSGDLGLSTANVDNPGERPEVWEKVVRKLRGRMMPPPGRPRPDDATYDNLVSYLETALDRAAAANPNPGRTTTFRRLNRTGYLNAIRGNGAGVDVWNRPNKRGWTLLKIVEGIPIGMNIAGDAPTRAVIRELLHLSPGSASQR